MPAVPSTEPTVITAGETLAWTKTLPDYPAPTYTLKYSLQRAGAPPILITATASGTSHAVSETATTTDAWTPGDYLWRSYVEASGGVRYTVESGSVRIQPSPLKALGETHAQQMLALIEAALKNRIPHGLESTDINGQRLDRIPIAKLHELRREYRIEADHERRAALAAAGIRQSRSIGIRFTRP